MLLNALIPDGTASMLLSHLQSVDDTNRRRIVELEQRGAWAELTEFADVNIAKDPFSPEWRMIGGYAQLQLRDYPRAMTYFSDMIRLAPDDATVITSSPKRSALPGSRSAQWPRSTARCSCAGITADTFSAGEPQRSRAVPFRSAGYRRDAGDGSAAGGCVVRTGRASLQLGRGADAREALACLEQMHRRAPLAADADRAAAVAYRRGGITGSSSVADVPARMERDPAAEHCRWPVGLVVVLEGSAAAHRVLHVRQRRCCAVPT